MTQAFLAAGKQRGFIACFDNDDAVRIEAGLCKRRREEIRTRDAPQDVTLRARRDARGKENSGGAVNGAGRATGDFMERGEGEACAGKDVIERGDAKRERRRGGAPCAHPAHIVPQLAQKRFVTHGFSPQMFVFCSFMGGSQTGLLPVVPQFEFALGKSTESQSLERFQEAQNFFLGRLRESPQTRMAPFSVYVALVRGALVDFGFGSLIDKFEERFGKRITTVLLAVVGLGIFAGCVGLIAGNLIKPGIELYNATNWPALKDWLIKQLIPTLVALGILFVLAHLLSRVGEEVYRRTIGRMLLQKRTDAHIKKSLAEYEERITREVSEIGDKAQAEAISAMSDMKQRLMSELHDAMETRDSAMAVSQEVISVVSSWLSELDETKPEESIEKSKEVIRMLKLIRPERPALSKEEPKGD